MGKYVIGVDLGGTKIACGIANLQGKVLHSQTISTPTTSAYDIYQAIAAIIKSIEALYVKEEIACIGLGIPGQIDLQKGVVINAPNLTKWNNFPLLKKLKKDFKQKIVLDNDANAAAIAELFLGAGKKLKNFVYLTVSTGIGSGIIINRNLYYGTNNIAGETGHIVIEAQAGKKAGKFEYLASGTGIARRAITTINKKSKLFQLAQGKTANITSKLIFEAAKKGDAFSKNLIRENGIYLAAGIVNLVNILDPEAIIIGGGLANSGKLFFDSIKEGLKKFELMTPHNKITILPAKLKKDSGLYGAIALALKEVNT